MAHAHTIQTVDAILKADSLVPASRRELALAVLEDGYVTARQAAAFLGIAPRTWFKRVHDGVYRVRRRRHSRKDVRYPFADVLAVARQEAKS